MNVIQVLTLYFMTLFLSLIKSFSAWTPKEKKNDIKCALHNSRDIPM